MTCLTRFLGTHQTVHAFGAMEKPPVALAMENKQLAMPVSMGYLPVAGDIEDMRPMRRAWWSECNSRSTTAPTA